MVLEYKVEQKNTILTDRIPLLLTGTIDANVYNNTGNRITDVNIRLEQYENSLRQYIEKTAFNPIVFIDNSGYDFDEVKYKSLAKKYNKEFEFIKGSVQYQNIIEKGKSFGDAFLIHEGLKKSNLLNPCEYFYKITGRIFLKNSNDIIRTRDKHKNEFICYTGLGWCLTNIFKCNKFDYLRVLDDVYLECNEKNIQDIEICFYKRLFNAEMEVESFGTYPVFEGIQGATLEQYSSTGITQWLRNVGARLGIFKLNSRSAKIVKVLMKVKGIRPYV